MLIWVVLCVYIYTNVHSYASNFLYLYYVPKNFFIGKIYFFKKKLSHSKLLDMDFFKKENAPIIDTQELISEGAIFLLR